MNRDNAEGSSASTELCPLQQSVLVGTILGDGCLAKHGHNHRLHVKHKLAHRALIEFKYRVFRDFISMGLHQFDQRLNGDQFPCLQFASRTHTLFSEWHRYFYREGVKIVPQDVEQYLTRQALAVWFMDDGAADYAGVTIQTHSFRAEEVTLLTEVLKQKFQLAATLRRNKGKEIIYIPARSMRSFRELVSPYLLPELAYKSVPRRCRTP
jgi:LAGLIDADG DNA endonuclease family